MSRRHRACRTRAAGPGRVAGRSRYSGSPAHRCSASGRPGAPASSAAQTTIPSGRTSAPAGAPGPSGTARTRPGQRSALRRRLTALPAAAFPHTTRHAAELTAGTGHERFDFAVRLLIDGLARR
ncbi:hypothetical protein GCM10020366_24260 [Saccharopolyspora gregorii]|uniref:Tetracycline repressor TetR C-terminal domain-containing protein n=1 Tax=Saccharopolyspora gregorii TaxID=33914 RepID=A0ABP6RSA8_9PSEU|nr:hypothetical protein [Saccharopolyspora gregorii]